ncbi:MAG: UvrD-helicase domain-containing protein, partial [Candidatus Sericytochromatia bacterium]|nr:UvrD-helicase domain-containing protein [Candidatus Tanganyikabacteria bacterium]
MTLSGSGEREWTPDQRRAIEEDGCSLLVSAAAGSGKTSVLVERIISRLVRERDPYDVGDFLVVTFTDAAAAEMRRRIADALADKLQSRPGDANLQRQLALLPRAAISTLHAFCKRLLRRFFHRSDLDPCFEVMSEHEALLLRDDVLDALFEKQYADPEAGEPGGFLDLVDRYGGDQGDRGLRQLIEALYNQSRSLPDPTGWLASASAAFCDRVAVQAWQAELLRQARFKALEAQRLLSQALRLCRQPGGPANLADILALEADVAGQVVATLAQPDVQAGDRVSVLGKIAFADLKSGPRADKDIEDPAIRERVRELRNAAKKALLPLRDGPLGDPELASRAEVD